MAQIVGTGALERVQVCLPEWAAGTIRSLELSMPARATTCDPATDEFLIDDLSVVDDPACADPGYVFDNGFESSVAAGAKLFYSRGTKTYFSYTPSYPKINGAGVMFMRGRSPSCSTESSATTTGTLFVSYPRAPSPTSPGAPRISFQYHADDNANVSYAVGGVALAATTAVQAGSICGSRSLAGRGLALDFTATVGCAGGGSGDLTVDDVSIAWDPTCP
jgi:hypothetical protein